MRQRDVATRVHTGGVFSLSLPAGKAASLFPLPGFTVPITQHLLQTLRFIPVQSFNPRINVMLGKGFSK
jgi:hypothetical protein